MTAPIGCRIGATCPAGPKAAVSLGNGETTVPASNRGFTLVETLMALAIVFLALTLSISVTVRHRMASERVKAHRSALEALEAAHETLRARANLVTLREGQWPIEIPSRSATGSPQLFMDVEQGEQRGLLRVTLRARYLLQGQVREQSLETLFWQP